jgi:hypothetical protein
MLDRMLAHATVSYRDAGAGIDAVNAQEESIKPLAKATRRRGAGERLAWESVPFAPTAALADA